jgi:hypothetical protein
MLHGITAFGFWVKGKVPMELSPEKWLQQIELAADFLRLPAQTSAK